MSRKMQQRGITKMEPWYKEIGFFSNPFSIKPLAFHDEVIGYDIDLVFNKIENGEVLFIEGDYGKGKTTILKKIIRRFGGKRELIYYSCNITDNNIDFDNLIKGRHGFFSSFFSDDENLILLLDEVQDLSGEDSEKLIDYYNKNFKSIVLVANNFDRVKLSNGLTKLVGSNIIRLGELTEGDGIAIIRKRTGNIRLLSDDIIKMIFKKSNRNPRKLLKNCEDVCRYSVSQGYNVAREEHVKKVLG